MRPTIFAAALLAFAGAAQAEPLLCGGIADNLKREAEWHDARHPPTSLAERVYHAQEWSRLTEAWDRCLEAIEKGAISPLILLDTQGD
jgi:hypothetical protein